MRLYVCWTTRGDGWHACGTAHAALREAGHRPDVVHAMGWRALPDTPFNQTPGRRRAKQLTGSSSVPVLELDDGTAVWDSKRIVEWAREHPVAA
jgi:glutathione S-transferase